MGRGIINKRASKKVTSCFRNKRYINQTSAAKAELKAAALNGNNGEAKRINDEGGVDNETKPF